MLWLPPEIGLKEQRSGDKKRETLVYEVEVVDISRGACRSARR